MIIDPLSTAAGTCLPKPEFLKALREVTEEHDILLIFDEIVAFRISPGGAQVRTRSLPLLPTPVRLNGFLPSAFVRAGGVWHHSGPDDAG